MMVVTKSRLGFEALLLAVRGCVFSLLLRKLKLCFHFMHSRSEVDMFKHKENAILLGNSRILQNFVKTNFYDL